METRTPDEVPTPERETSGSRGGWDVAREDAIPRLLELHGGRLYGLGLRLCGSPEQAEDLVQETFLRAFRRWDQFEGRSDPVTWLYTIAARVCQRMHRRRSGEPERVQSLDDAFPLGDTMADLRGADAAGSALSEAIRSEGRARVGEAIAGLPLRFRLCLVLKEILGLSVSQVAEVLGLEAATVKTRLHRARLAVRNALEAALPSREAPPPAYRRQVCLDLLRAKQEALDRGVPFPVESEVLCERCRTVFATLDLTRDLCADLARGELPDALRRELLGELR